MVKLSTRHPVAMRRNGLDQSIFMTAASENCSEKKKSEHGFEDTMYDVNNRSLVHPQSKNIKLVANMDFGVAVVMESSLPYRECLAF